MSSATLRAARRVATSMKPIKPPNPQLAFKSRCLSTKHVAAADRMAAIGPNVFADFSMLAVKHDAVNLGQGFPSFDKPDFVRECATEALSENQDQYTRPGGHPELVRVLGDIYSDLLGWKVDPMTEICTSQGAQLMISHIFMAFMNPGDEVIVIEPYFDSYIKSAHLTGSKVVGVPMDNDPSVASSEGWVIDPAKLEAAITPRTKLLILNTPHNPVGKMLSRAEMEGIAAVLKRHPDVIVLSDEVYEFATFDGNRHERIATLPDMKERTISVHSAGKTFCTTGWRVGYAIGAPNLIEPLVRMQTATTFCGTTPLEVACAKAFALARTNGYLENLGSMMAKKRDFLCNALTKAGLPAITPEGGYFIMCDSSRVKLPSTTCEERRDFQVAKHLTTEAKVACIPPSAFYQPHNQHRADNLLRFCFTKDDASLAEAAERLKNF